MMHTHQAASLSSTHTAILRHSMRKSVPVSVDVTRSSAVSINQKRSNDVHVFSRNGIIISYTNRVPGSSTYMEGKHPTIKTIINVAREIRAKSLPELTSSHESSSCLAQTRLPFLKRRISCLSFSIPRRLSSMASSSAPRLTSSCTLHPHWQLTSLL